MMPACMKSKPVVQRITFEGLDAVELRTRSVRAVALTAMHALGFHFVLAPIASQPSSCWVSPWRSTGSQAIAIRAPQFVQRQRLRRLPRSHSIDWNRPSFLPNRSTN